MNLTLDFLKQPIVLTLITLFVGSYLLNLVAERRSRRDKLRDQAIDFLTDASDYFGELVPHLYEQLRTRNLKTTPEILDELRGLFSRRMSIQVGSQAYLKSDAFYRKYFQLLDEFPGVIEALQTLERGEDAQSVIHLADRHCKQLLERWPLEGESFHQQTGQPADALILWMDLVMHRMADLITSHLEAVMK